jgi:RNA polymerase-binding transcription factor DksA
MNTKHLENLLRERERLLQSNLAHLKDETIATGEIEVRDSIDDASLSQGVSESFEEAAVLSRELEQVQRALNRIIKDAYGKCPVCGQEIDAYRLEVTPSTEHCLEDEDKDAA